MNGMVKQSGIKTLDGPWRITFDTNPDSCNINCIMCEEHSNFRMNHQLAQAENNAPRIMESTLIASVINSAAPYGLREIIPSTMGEPLLYPWFDEFIKNATKHELKVNLTTNGTFPNGGVAYWAKKILPVASDVKISINGSVPSINEKIMSGISHQQQLENIERLLSIRDEIRDSGVNYPTVTFQLTFMRSNLSDIENLVKLAVEMGADRVKGHHLWVTWPELQAESLLNDIESIRRWNKTVDSLRKFMQRKQESNIPTIRLDNFHPLPEKNQNNEIIPNEWTCPFTGREAWISWDGTFNVCCCPDEKRKTFGDFGNVLETNFMELWESDRYRSHTMHTGNHKVCKECNMRRPLEEVC